MNTSRTQVAHNAPQRGSDVEVSSRGMRVMDTNRHCVLTTRTFYLSEVTVYVNDGGDNRIIVLV